MKQVLVLGAGTIGSVIARLLQGSGDYRVTLADREAAQLAGLAPGVTPAVADLSSSEALEALAKGRFA
ncbi:saccharopine dehydrogenase NADP-binding domain-containing protein, partial [Acinetobacter baumannii]